MTYIIIAFTVFISIMAFNNNELAAKLRFNAFLVYHKKEYYRLITHGFVHGDWMHLFVNMYVFYIFGDIIEKVLPDIIPYPLAKFSPLLFLLIYISALIVSSLLSIFKHRNNEWYNAVGASGAVSTFTFFFIFLFPWHILQLFFIIPIPGIIFGVLYLIYSNYMSKKGRDNIGHDAHFMGAIYGFIVPIILNPGLLTHFINELLNFSFN